MELCARASMNSAEKENDEKISKKNAVGKKAMYFLFWFMVMTLFWNLFFKKE
jgi:hypothetical protein